MSVQNVTPTYASPVRLTQEGHKALSQLRDLYDCKSMSDAAIQVYEEVKGNQVGIFVKEDTNILLDGLLKSTGYANIDELVPALVELINELEED